MPTFQTNILGDSPPALKIETVCLSETLASTGEATRRQNPEEHHHPHRRENLRSQQIRGMFRIFYLPVVCLKTQRLKYTVFREEYLDLRRGSNRKMGKLDRHNEEFFQILVE
jgi:hypothetical protein